MSPATAAEFEERIRKAAALAAEVKRLEPQYNALAKELAEKKGALAELLGMDAETQDLANAAFGRGLAASSGSTTSKVLAACKANKGRPMTAEEIADLIKAEDVNSIRSLLSRLAKRGDVKKVKRGRYLYPPS
jgi:hypothetical protein